MLIPLVWATIAVCVGGALFAYFSTEDVFHPAIMLAGLCAFMYGYMPLSLMKNDELYSYVTPSQAEFCQTVALLGITLLLVGCFVGAGAEVDPAKRHSAFAYSGAVLQKGAYILGGIGMACWLITIRGAGGFTGAFGAAAGTGQSDIGYVRDAVYLLVVALILLLTPQVFRNRDKKWYAAVVIFTIPWLMQGLLGARRGPTFVIVATLAMSWYMVRGKRPPVPLLIIGAGLLGMLMLFLVTNRNKIYIGSDFSNLKTDITAGVTEATESNEYIFGIACIETVRRTENYFWGKRYLAEFLVRPIPHQIWPTKYEDFGVTQIEWNGGVAGRELPDVMGWRQAPGAAGAMIADLWVEFSWLIFPVLFGLGYLYGYVWKRAVEEGGLWNSQYTIFAVLAIYLVTQSGEAVIFRFIFLTVPTRWVWRKAQLAEPVEYFEEEPLCVS